MAAKRRVRLTRNQGHPSDLFNALIPAGRPSRPLNRQSTPSRAQGRTRRLASVKRGSSGRERVVRALQNSGIGSSGYTPEASQIAWQNAYERLTDDFRQSAAEQEAINRVNQDQEEEAEQDLPWYQDITRAIGLSNPFNEETGWQDSLVGRTLDILSRPAYGLAEGLQSLGEQETHRGYSGGDIGFTLGNFFSGVGRGLSGEDKTGFGQVYEAVKENEASDIGSGLRAFEEAHPLIEQRMSQALGFGGELFLDPLNRFTPTRSRILADNPSGAGFLARNVTGTNATSDVLRRTILNAADDVTRDLQAGNPSWAANPASLLSRVENAVASSFDNTLLETSHGGRRQARLNPRGFAETASSAAAMELRTAITDPLRELVSRFRNPVGRNIRQNFTLRKFENALRNNPEFEEFYLKFIADPSIQRLLPANPTPAQVYQLVQKPGIQRSTAWQRVLDDVLAKYDGEVTDFRDRLVGEFNNVSYPTLGVRFYGKEIPIKFPGKAYKFVGSKLDGHGPFGSDIFERMSIGRILPDRVSLFSTRARSGNITGMPSLEKFNADLRKMGRNYSKQEMADIAKYLDEGTQSIGVKKIDDALAFIRAKQQEIFDREVFYGVRSADELADDYNFIYNKGGSAQARKDFKEGRKAAFRDKNKRGAGAFGLAEARARGLKPTEHAFENLFRRFEKSQRDITRQLFLKDLLDNYATMAKPLKADMAAKMNLRQVPHSQLPEAMRLAAEKSGEVVYLPRHMFSGKPLGTKGGTNGFFEDFAEMLSWSPQESGRFTRNFAKIINMIKYLQTVPNPGFHMRNMMGDIAMGLMDDINPSDYAKIIKKYATKGSFEVVPGVTLTWDEMVDLFHRNADAGFFQVDTGTYNSLTAGSIPKDFSRKMVNKLRKASDIREEMGRFVHFATAYQQEARALWKKGTRDLDRIKTLSEDAALWRVNAYRFDYGALTPFEQKIKTLAFPFYTYQRKAIPLLLEQMYSNPQFLTMANRFMQYNDGSGADAFNSLNIPQYIRDMGFAITNPTEEPTYIGADALNLGSLNLLASTSPEDFARTALSNLNPLAAAPIELGTNTDLYMNRPLNQGFMEYILNQVPMAGDIQSETGFDIPGIPGHVGTENPLTARFAGIGLPWRHISSGQQEQQHEANLDEAIDSPIKQFNYSQDLYQITEDVENGQMVFTLRNRITGKPLGRAATPQELIEFAQRQPNANYQEPDVNTLRPPTYQDILTRMGQ